MIIPICWVRDRVVRNVMHLHRLFSRKKNASQLWEVRTVKVHALLHYANAGKLGQTQVYQEAVSGIGAPSEEGGYWGCPESLCLGTPKPLLGRELTVLMRIFMWTPPLALLHRILKARMHVMGTIWEIRKVRPRQPLGHVQAVHRKGAPISRAAIGSFPGTFSLKAPKTLQGREQSKVLPIFINEGTEANAIWDVSFVLILCSSH